MGDALKDSADRVAAWSRRGLGICLGIAGLALAFAGHGGWGSLLFSFMALCFAPEFAAVTKRLTQGTGLTLDVQAEAQDLVMQAHRARAAGDIDEAVHLLKQAAESNSMDQEIRYQLADLHRVELKDREAACYWYEKVIEYGRGTDREAEAFLRMIRLLVDKGDREGASRLLGLMRQDFRDHPLTAESERVLTL